jgi:chemotaxis protein MotA
MFLTGRGHHGRGSSAFAIIFVMVFGGYVLHGGNLDIVLEAAPWELIMIGGAAVGAFVVANDGASIKQTLKGRQEGVSRVPQWKPRRLPRSALPSVRTDPAGEIKIPSLSRNISKNPEGSSIFGKYPRIQHDHESVELICDTMRSASMNYDDPPSG